MNKAQLAEELDCMSLRDFFQYYKGRYFGILSGADPNIILPAFITSALHGNDTFVATIFDPQNKTLVPMEINLRSLKERGRFGCPLLGTAIIGPTYSYFLGNPVRESLKGVALSRFDPFIPNYQFI